LTWKGSDCCTVRHVVKHNRANLKYIGTELTKHMVGQNDTCPCGSGKKYKKCCGRANAIADSSVFPKPVDLVMLRMVSLMARSGLDVWKWSRQIVEGIEKAIFSEVPRQCVLPSDKAASVLQKFLMKLEDEMRRILSADSRYFWLFLSRRLSIDPRKFQSSRLTTELCWTIMNLAIFKHGLDTGRQFVAISDIEAAERWALSGTEDEPLKGDSQFKGGSILPIQLTLDDVKNIFLVEQLAYYYWGCTATLRRVYKGGKLRIKDGLHGRVKHDKDTAWLINFYDKRLQYSNLLGDIGTAIGPRILEKLEGHEFDLWAGLPNTWQIKVPITWLEDKPFAYASGEATQEQMPDLIIPNYVWVPISLQAFREKSMLFREVLTEFWEVSPEEFMSFLIAVSDREWQYFGSDSRARMQIMERGYSIDWGNKFLDEILSVYKTTYSKLHGTCNNQRAKKVCNGLLQKLTYNEHSCSSIDLWERTGRKPFLDSEFGLICDYTAFSDMIKMYFEPLNRLSGAVGKVKGKAYEKDVAAYLASHATGFDPWLVSRRIRSDAGGYLDIDVSGTCGNVLYIFECKCHYLNLAFDRGLPEELEKRRIYYSKALAQADNTAKFLASHPKGKSYEVPSSIDFIVSGAISPHPEYINERSQSLFFTERIPRICTPEEAAAFISTFEPQCDLTQPWLFTLS
jgi:hypothetical protein